MNILLVEALEKAKKAALERATHSDGGTCNFDSPVLDYRGSSIRKKQAVESIKAAGLSCFDWKPFGGTNMLVINGAFYGQAARRTAMAEAFRDSLKQSGFATMMYYQMD